MKKVRIEVTQEHYERSLLQHNIRGKTRWSVDCMIAQALKSRSISFTQVGYTLIWFPGAIQSPLSKRVSRIVQDLDFNKSFKFEPFTFYLKVPTLKQLELDL